MYFYLRLRIIAKYARGNLYYDETLKTCPDYEFFSRIGTHFGDERLLTQDRIFFRALGDRTSMSFRPEALTQFCRDKLSVLERYINARNSSLIQSPEARKATETLGTLAMEARAGVYCWGAEMANALDPGCKLARELIEVAMKFDPRYPRIERFLRRMPNYSMASSRQPVLEEIVGNLQRPPSFCVYNPQWNSRVIPHDGDEVEIVCGDHVWGNAAELALQDIFQSLGPAVFDPANDYEVEVELTSLSGEICIALGSRTRSDDFLSEIQCPAGSDRHICRFKIDPIHPALFLMVRNGAMAHSIARIHKVRILKISDIVPINVAI
jgi:hypothetical protein